MTNDQNHQQVTLCNHGNVQPVQPINGFMEGWTGEALPFCRGNGKGYRAFILHPLIIPYPFIVIPLDCCSLWIILVVFCHVDVMLRYLGEIGATYESYWWNSLEAWEPDSGFHNLKLCCRLISKCLRYSPWCFNSSDWSSQSESNQTPWQQTLGDTSWSKSYPHHPTHRKHDMKNGYHDHSVVPIPTLPCLQQLQTLWNRCSWRVNCGKHNYLKAATCFTCFHMQQHRQFITHTMQKKHAAKYEKNHPVLFLGDSHQMCIALTSCPTVFSTITGCHQRHERHCQVRFQQRPNGKLWLKRRPCRICWNLPTCKTFWNSQKQKVFPTNLFGLRSLLEGATWCNNRELHKKNTSFNQNFGRANPLTDFKNWRKVCGSSEKSSNRLRRTLSEVKQWNRHAGSGRQGCEVWSQLELVACPTGTNKSRNLFTFRLLQLLLCFGPSKIQRCVVIRLGGKRRKHYLNDRLTPFFVIHALSCSKCHGLLCDQGFGLHLLNLQNGKGENCKGFMLLCHWEKNIKKNNNIASQGWNCWGNLLRLQGIVAQNWGVWVPILTPKKMQMEKFWPKHTKGGHQRKWAKKCYKICANSPKKWKNEFHSNHPIEMGPTAGATSWSPAAPCMVEPWSPGVGDPKISKQKWWF